MNKPNGQGTLQTGASAQIARVPDTAGGGVAALPQNHAEKLRLECCVREAVLEMQIDELRQSLSALEELRDLYVDIYGIVPIGYFTLTRDGIISETNPTGSVLLRVEQKKLLNRQFAHFVMPQDGDRWRQYFMEAAHYGRKQSCELALKRGDGSVFPAKLFCPYIGAGSDLPIRIALTDITRHKQTEEELRIATIAFETQEGMLLTDTNGVILRVNRAFTQLTGYNAEEAVGKTPRMLKSGRHDPSFYRRLWANLVEKHYWEGEIWNRHKDGNICAERMTITAVTMPDGWRVTHYVCTYSDISRRDSETERDTPLGWMQAAQPLSNIPNN